MRIAVTGSLAYDYLMEFPGYFKDYLIQEKADSLAISFLVHSMRRLRGGVAGNIAYSLALLGERPLVVGTVGQDFSDYRAWLDAQGVDTSGIREISHDFTASCFINTDQSNNQIVSFYAGAMAHAASLSFGALGLGSDDLVLISPTDPVAMERYAIECQQLGIPYVFDPGKQTPRLEAEHILLGLKGAAVMVGNEYEYAMMANKTGRSEQEILNTAPISVVTRGEQGSLVYRRNSDPIEIPVAPVAEVRDPTGAGDAYLAGLVAGLVRGLPLPVCGRIGALASAYVIEQNGCQEHTYSLEEFATRYADAFGENLVLNGVGTLTMLKD